MRSGLFFGCALISLAAIAAEAPKTRATLTMVDGSSVKGELLTEEIKGITTFDQKVAVPVGLLRSVTPGTTNTPSKLAFANGDTLSIKMTTDEFKLKSLLGKLEIPASNVRKAAFSSSANGKGLVPTEGLTFACTFDDAEAMRKPVAGPALRWNSAEAYVADGHDGGAIRIGGERSPITAILPPGLVRERGAVDFWAKLDNPPPSLSVGWAPRFFSLKALHNGQCMCFDLASDNGVGNCGLCGGGWTTSFGQTFDELRRLASNGYSPAPYSEVLHGDANGWHHYAIVWNANGIDSEDIRLHGKMIAVFLDGQINSTLDHWNNRVWGITGSRVMLTLGGDQNSTNRQPFLLDDFRVWDTDRTEFGD